MTETHLGEFSVKQSMNCMNISIMSHLGYTHKYNRSLATLFRLPQSF